MSDDHVPIVRIRHDGSALYTIQKSYIGPDGEILPGPDYKDKVKDQRKKILAARDEIIRQGAEEEWKDVMGAGELQPVLYGDEIKKERVLPAVPRKSTESLDAYTGALRTRAENLPPEEVRDREREHLESQIDLHPRNRKAKRQLAKMKREDEDVKAWEKYQAGKPVPVRSKEPDEEEGGYTLGDYIKLTTLPNGELAFVSDKGEILSDDGTVLDQLSVDEMDLTDQDGNKATSRYDGNTTKIDVNPQRPLNMAQSWVNNLFHSKVESMDTVLEQLGDLAGIDFGPEFTKVLSKLTVPDPDNPKVRKTLPSTTQVLWNPGVEIDKSVLPEKIAGMESVKDIYDTDDEGNPENREWKKPMGSGYLTYITVPLLSAMGLLPVSNGEGVYRTGVSPLPRSVSKILGHRLGGRLFEGNEEKKLPAIFNIDEEATYNNAEPIDATPPGETEEEFLSMVTDSSPTPEEKAALEKYVDWIIDHVVTEIEGRTGAQADKRTKQLSDYVALHGIHNLVKAAGVTEEDLRDIWYYANEDTLHDYDLDEESGLPRDIKEAGDRDYKGVRTVADILSANLIGLPSESVRDNANLALTFTLADLMDRSGLAQAGVLALPNGKTSFLDMLRDAKGQDFKNGKNKEKPVATRDDLLGRTGAGPLFQKAYNNIWANLHNFATKVKRGLAEQGVPPGELESQDDIEIFLDHAGLGPDARAIFADSLFDTMMTGKHNTPNEVTEVKNNKIYLNDSGIGGLKGYASRWMNNLKMTPAPSISKTKQLYQDVEGLLKNYVQAVGSYGSGTQRYGSIDKGKEGLALGDIIGSDTDAFRLLNAVRQIAPHIDELDPRSKEHFAVIEALKYLKEIIGNRLESEHYYVSYPYFKKRDFFTDPPTPEEMEQIREQRKNTKFDDDYITFALRPERFRGIFPRWKQDVKENPFAPYLKQKDFGFTLPDYKTYSAMEDEKKKEVRTQYQQALLNRAKQVLSSPNLMSLFSTDPEKLDDLSRADRALFEKIGLTPRPLFEGARPTFPYQFDPEPRQRFRVGHKDDDTWDYSEAGSPIQGAGLMASVLEQILEQRRLNSIMSENDELRFDKEKSSEQRSEATQKYNDAKAALESLIKYGVNGLPGYNALMSQLIRQAHYKHRPDYNTAESMTEGAREDENQWGGEDEENDDLQARVQAAVRMHNQNRFGENSTDYLLANVASELIRREAGTSSSGALGEIPTDKLTEILYTLLKDGSEQESDIPYANGNTPDDTNPRTTLEAKLAPIILDWPTGEAFGDSSGALELIDPLYYQHPASWYMDLIKGLGPNPVYDQDSLSVDAYPALLNALGIRIEPMTERDYKVEGDRKRYLEELNWAKLNDPEWYRKLLSMGEPQLPVQIFPGYKMLTAGNASLVRSEDGEESSDEPVYLRMHIGSVSSTPELPTGEKAIAWLRPKKTHSEQPQGGSVHKYDIDKAISERKSS